MTNGLITSVIGCVHCGSNVYMQTTAWSTFCTGCNRPAQTWVDGFGRTHAKCICPECVRL